jgi:succinate dehydrogenase / fumarate reductase cytochrome b subunit
MEEASRGLEGQERAKNRKGVLGWLIPFGQNRERWAYSFQRMTGVAVLLYVLGHLGDTSFFVGGPTGAGPDQSSWSFISGLVENSFGHLILVLVVLVITFHGINGIRLILSELGFLFKKPGPIEYPYKARALNSAQWYLILAGIAMAIFAALLAWWILFEGAL